MRTPRGDGSRARREAAAWFTRLSRRAVTTEALREFRDWRSRPANQAEYRRLEQIWDESGRLSADPDIAELRRETLERTQGRTRRLRGGQNRLRRPILLAGAGLTAAVAAVVVLLAVFNASPVYESGVGEQRIVRLADGTVLRLDTDSRAVVRFADRARRVELQRGQAFFDVAHDPRRPFTVRAGQTTVTALGTAFDVRRNDGAVQVVLVEGRVRVQGGEASAAVVLQPNQKVTVVKDQVQAPAPADVRTLTSWTERRLTFQATPLEQALAEVNRYTDAKVRLEAQDLAESPVSGVFETGDTQAFAAAVASLFDLEVERRGGSLVLQRPRAPAG